MAVGGLLAYICRPVVARMERFRVPRSVAIGLLLLVFVLAALVIVNRIRAVMPSDTEALELRRLLIRGFSCVGFMACRPCLFMALFGPTGPL